MVVVAIIGLVSAIAVITFTSNRRDTELDQEAERLDALFSYVREQAELQTRDYGFRINDRNYSFVVFDVLVTNGVRSRKDDALRERNFPEGIVPQWWSKAAPWCSTVARRKSRTSRRRSSSFRTATCRRSKFELRRDGGDERARIYTDEQTNVRLLLPGETEPTGPPVTAAAR
jgi:type II secretion system protein H